MKAVLVLNEMPESCRHCKFCEIAKDSYDSCYDIRVCKATGSLMSARAIGSKPDWCPLKELPEREINYHITDADIESIRFDYEGTPAYMAGHKDGWNECLDAIEGKGEVVWNA